MLSPSALQQNYNQPTLTNNQNSFNPLDAKMLDPLSIAATSATLAQLCFKASSTSVSVSSYITDARSIDDNIQSLHQGLNALSQVLTGVGLAWTSNPEVASAQSGPDGLLWISVKDSISRCSIVLDKFQRMLDKISTDGGTSRSILRRTVTKVKFDLSATELDGLKAEIDVYHRILMIALNSINTCAMLRRDRSDAAVADRLGNIEDGIYNLSGRLRGGRKSNAESVNGLKTFLQAASAFHSNASEFSSSGSTVTGDNATERGGSVFEVPLSKDRSNRIKDWIAPQSDDKLHDDTTEDVPSSSSFNQSFHEVESLPQLLSVLENAAQMANRFQAVEKQRTSTKDEEIRSLQERCSTYEMTLADFRMKFESAIQDQEREKEALIEAHEQRIKHRTDLLHTTVRNQVAIYRAKYFEEQDTIKKDHKKRLDESDRELNLQRNLRENLERRLAKRDRELDLHVETNSALSTKMKALQAELSNATKLLSDQSEHIKDLDIERLIVIQQIIELQDNHHTLLAEKELWQSTTATEVKNAFLKGSSQSHQDFLKLVTEQAANLDKQYSSDLQQYATSTETQETIEPTQQQPYPTQYVDMNTSPAIATESQEKLQQAASFPSLETRPVIQSTSSHSSQQFDSPQPEKRLVDKQPLEKRWRRKTQAPRIKVQGQQLQSEQLQSQQRQSQQLQSQVL